MNTPVVKVSIIIPCYNQAQFLEESVQSALDQTYGNIEIIIVNDGSQDNTQEIAEGLQKKYPEEIHIVNQKNMGLSEARNSGIRESSGKYIVSMDSDDKLYETMVEKCITIIQHHNADIVYTGYQGFGISDRVNMWTPFDKTNPLYNTPCGALAFIKKKVWEVTGGYKYNMKEGYEDWEFWVNAYKRNMKFIHIPEKLYFYRIKNESMVTNAMKKDAYLKAKIVMNHPELYTTHRVKESIEEIHKNEDLADVYFYIPKNILKVDTEVIQAINNFLSTNNISDIYQFTIEEQKIELYALDNQNDKETIEKILKKNDTNKVLFYAQMRYEVKGLNNCHFAWKDGVMIKAQGTFFPYVFKKTREDTKSQLLAYQRFVEYQNKKINISELEIERQVQVRETKDKLIRKKDILIEDLKQTIFSEREKKDILIEDLKQTIFSEREKKDILVKDLKQTIFFEREKLSENRQLLKEIMSSIKEITKYSTKTKPITKYKAYKAMIQTYYRLK